MKATIEDLIYELSFRVRLLTEQRKASLSSMDLSETEELIIDILDKKKRLNITEIGKLIPSLKPSTISSMISRLDKEKQLLSRQRSLEDERKVFVELSDKGKEKLAQMKKARYSIFNTIVTGLNLTPSKEKVIREVINEATGYFDNILQWKDETSKN